MTWPFENDTSAITKKLAERNLKADKSRNILIIITIALAACLIMTTTLYFFASQRKSLNDAAGHYQAIINEVDNDTITKFVNDDRIQVGVSHLSGLVSYGDYKSTVRSMDETLMKLAKYPDLAGELPESTNEIAITKAFLDRAGLSKSIGDTISLDLGDGEKDYILCGILPVENSNYSVFVSQSYIENKISEPAYSAYIRLNESDGWSKSAIQAELTTLCRELEIQPEQMQFSTYYFSLIEQRSSQYIAVIAFISLIIALASILVIYSLFYVSIARKTKEYGKLRTIGATGKQMKKIVFREGFHLSGIGIPVGILTGAIAGYVLVPQGWNTLMVFVIAAVTALFVYLCETCFSRKAAFRWFVSITIGLMLRSDKLGGTSIIRDLALHPGCYGSMLHFFRASSWSLEEIRGSLRPWSRWKVKSHARKCWKLSVPLRCIWHCPALRWGFYRAFPSTLSGR